MTEVENREANVEGARKNAADLYWLAFLLTGRHGVSIEVATDTAASQDDGTHFFKDWMQGWSRRLVIAKALDAIREELAESARRTKLARTHQPAALPRDWALSNDTTKAQIEEALLAIDVFPRAAFILSIFEGEHIADAATLLDADADLVRKGQAIGAREFAANLARNKDNAVRGSSPMPASGQATH